MGETQKNVVLKDDLRLYRTLFLVATIIFTAFGFLLTRVAPESYDSIIGRATISSIILICYLLTYISSVAKKEILKICYGLAYLIWGYYIFLLIKNEYSLPYSLGIMVIIFGVSVIFKSNRGLLWFLNLSIVAVASGFFVVSNPVINPMLILSLVITTGILVYISMGSRLRFQIALDKSNFELTNAYEEINEQKKIVDIRNKHFTDSITYAKRIQEVILPATTKVNTLLPNSFIFHEPKDIVSGDFYWMDARENTTWFAAVDCTGHGVPGAFMSIVANNLLQQTIRNSNVNTPAEALDEIRKGLIETLGKNTEKHDVRDGMDLGFCTLDYNKAELQFAGAYNSLYHIRNGVLKELKANRQPIDVDENKEIGKFTNYVLPLEKGDCVYLFTDGYPDQFGGEKGKKFKYNRFKELLVSIHAKPMEEQHDLLKDTIEKWRGGLEQIDDILVMGVRF